jgi:hypothetical protein
MGGVAIYARDTEDFRTLRIFLWSGWPLDSFVDFSWSVVFGFAALFGSASQV